MREAMPEARHRHRRQALLIGAAAIAVLVIGAVGFRAWLTAEPARVTIDNAVDRFRRDGDPSSAAPASIPTPGVYVYATSGTEKVDALGGDSHTYPDPSTVTVTVTECGYSLDWAPLEGRSDRTDLCRSGAGLVEAGSHNAHEFFHMSQDEAFTCDAGVWWLPPPDTATWTGTCHSSTGRTLARSARTVGREQVTVGGQPVDAVHVHWDDTLTGASSGTTATDLWLDPATGLTLRQHSSATTANDTVIGRVTFDESIDMDLQATMPRQ